MLNATAPEEGWQRQALCRELPHWWFVGELTEWETDRAKDICARCPVMAECRALGDISEARVIPSDLQGVWGGEHPVERAKRRQPNYSILPPPYASHRIIRWKSAADAPCGTLTKYTDGCHCFECCEANRYHEAAEARRAREGRTFGPKHTCRTSPRCDSCKAKRAKRARDARAIKKAQNSSGVTIVCGWCSEVMLETDRRKQKRKFCSRDCYRKHKWETERK